MPGGAAAADSRGRSSRWHRPTVPASSTAVFVRGAALVTYTYGLIERRGKPLNDGLAVQSQHPDQVCFSVMDRLVDDVVSQDHVAVLAPPASHLRGQQTTPSELGA